MEQTTEKAPKSAKKQKTFADTALEVGGRFLELAVTGIVLGGASALGGRIVSGGRSQAMVTRDEQSSVVPIRKTGTA